MQVVTRVRWTAVRLDLHRSAHVVILRLRRSRLFCGLCCLSMNKDVYRVYENHQKLATGRGRLRVCVCFYTLSIKLLSAHL